MTRNNKYLEDRDTVYKLRGILEDWANFNVNWGEENRQHAIGWLSGSYLEESEIVEDGCDLLNARIPNYLDTSYIEDKDNWSDLIDFGKKMGEWLDDNLDLKEYKKPDPTGEDWSIKVIGDLRKYLVNCFAWKVAREIKEQCEELVDDLEDEESSGPVKGSGVFVKASD